MDGKFSEKKRRVADVEVLAGYFCWRNHRQIQKDSPCSDVTTLPFKLPTESPRDLKWQIRTMTCQFFRQNHWRTHRLSFHRWNRRKKLIYVSFVNTLLPYFSFFFLVPPLPKQKSPSYQHNKFYFLKFCGHNIRVLIYRRILSIFVSNSIFLNYNI
jgi:hypothetical protein